MIVRRGRLAASALTSVALAAGALVAVAPAASAVVPTKIMFVDASTRQLKIGAPDGTGASVLTPAGVDVRSFGVSDTGGTIAIGTASGPRRALGFPLAAYALWVKDNAGVRTVSSLWDTRPAVTSGGDFVVWSTSGVTSASLFAYSKATHSTVRLCNGCVPLAVGSHGDAFVIRVDAQPAPAPATNSLRVAVSTEADTTAGLVAGTRVQVLDIATNGLGGHTGVMDVTTAPATVTPSTSFPGYELALSTDATALVSTHDTRTTDATSPWSATGLSFWRADLTAPSPAFVSTGLAGFYGARQAGPASADAGTWFVEHDTATTTQTSTSTDLLAGNAGVPATTTLVATRADGDHTFGYQPVSEAVTGVTAPARQVPAVEFLDPAASTVRFGVRAALDPYEFYGPPGVVPGLTPQGVLAALGTVYTDGVLQASANGTTGWTGVANRAGTVAGEIWDHTFVPVRTQWYRWLFPGSANLAAKTSPKTRISVVTVLTASRVKRGAKTNVYGRASRPSGTVVLQRLSGRRWVKVATAKVVRTKTYAFGLRVLVKGSYRVVSVGDTYQAAGVSNRVGV